MALAFVSVSIVHAGGGSSATGLSAYVAREERTDITGKAFDFTERKNDLIGKGILLPDGAPESFRDGTTLWNAATEAETVIDRATGEIRFSERAGRSPQVAKHFIVALPWDDAVTDDHRVTLADGFIRQQFGEAGVAVEWALHRYGSAFNPADAAADAEIRAQVELIRGLGLEMIRLRAGAALPEIRGPHVLVWTQPDGSERWQLYQPHAHVLVSTRRLTTTGFRTATGRATAKARELNPDFGRGGRVTEEQGWRHRWRDYQAAFFAERGIEVEIHEERAVPDRHRGKARSAGTVTAIENGDRAAERQEIGLDPDAMLDHLVKGRSIFTLRDVVAALRRHGVPSAEIDAAADGILNSDRVARMVEPGTGRSTGLMTTREVREEEEAAFADWTAAAAIRHPLSDRALAFGMAGLEGEQAAAYRHALSGAGVTAIQGDPGTGKSFTMARIRRAVEADGEDVWGLAAMNAVVRDLGTAEAKGGGGFNQVETLTAFLGRLEDGRLVPGRRPCWIVDEAAMADNHLLARLGAAARKFHARVVIVGDDKQNGAVGRGGLFADITESLGAARLSDVRRHAADWQRQATRDLAAGRVAEAVASYDDHGRVRWTTTLDEARAALVEHAKAIMAQGGDVYALASTNRDVDIINPHIRAARGLPPGVRVQGARGEIEISPGERIQLYGSRKREGLYNATFGTVESISKDGVMGVIFDDGRRAIINSKKWRDFGYGYAGTVYRDQGKTRREILALYDSKYMWGKETALVGMSRQKDDVHLYVPRELAADRDALVKGMTRSRAKRSTLRWITAEQMDWKSLWAAKGTQPESIITEEKTDHGKQQLTRVRRALSGRFSTRFNSAAEQGAGGDLARAPTLHGLHGVRGGDLALPEDRGQGADQSLLSADAADQLGQRQSDAALGLRRDGFLKAEEAGPPPASSAPQPSADEVAAGVAAARAQYDLRKTAAAGAAAFRERHAAAKAAEERAAAEAAAKAAIERAAAEAAAKAAEERRAAQEAEARQRTRSMPQYRPRGPRGPSMG